MFRPAARAGTYIVPASTNSASTGYSTDFMRICPLSLLRPRMSRLSAEPSSVNSARRPVDTSRLGELDQIQFLLGHMSIQTAERYLRVHTEASLPLNDRLGI